MPTLWAASIRHLLRHPAQLALALIGLSVGVGTIIAVDIATASSGRAFELSMQAVNGAATHQLIGGPLGIDERAYVDLRTRHSQPALAPIVEGYVAIGDRTLQLVGIDPLASPKLDSNADLRGADSGRWFTQPGAVVLAASTASQLGLAVNGKFELDVGGKLFTAVLIGTIGGEEAGYDALILTDIAQAQEWLGLSGRLSRIDVRVPAGAPGDAAANQLRASLPPGVRLEAAQSRARQSIDMTAAFTTNLQAMSLLALMVSTLLIYGAISFAVVQRRRIIGILRALGATRGNVLTIVLSEAAVLGIVGAGLGLLLGVIIGRGLVQLVSQTINDLYFVVAVNETILPANSVVKALLAASRARGCRQYSAAGPAPLGAGGARGQPCAQASLYQWGACTRLRDRRPRIRTQPAGGFCGPVSASAECRSVHSRGAALPGTGCGAPRGTAKSDRSPGLQRHCCLT
jgi:putative ABC transport system permease protein